MSGCIKKLDNNIEIYIDKRNIPEVVDQRKKEKKSFFDADELVSDHGEGEEGEDEEYNDHEYDNNDHTTVPDNFHWFFNPTSLTSHESDNSNKKTKYTKEVIPSSGDKVYHFIHPSLVLQELGQDHIDYKSP